jgi:hypothetical protein
MRYHLKLADRRWLVESIEFARPAGDRPGDRAARHRCAHAALAAGWRSMNGFAAQVALHWIAVGLYAAATAIYANAVLFARRRVREPGGCSRPPGSSRTRPRSRCAGSRPGTGRTC